MGALGHAPEGYCMPPVKLPKTTVRQHLRLLALPKLLGISQGY